MRSLLGVLALGVVAVSPVAWAKPHATPAADPSPPAVSENSVPADALPSDEPPASDAAPATTKGPHPTGVAKRLADWIAAHHDSDGMPFMIVDKRAAEAFVFDADGQLTASAPVLVGLAKGDDSAAGVGDEKLADIPRDERTTPAGRFVSEFGGSDGHGRVLWVDFPDAISLHPVITTNPAEHRLRRIKSASPDEHRISFGCINVPAKFYHEAVETAFADGGVVYILPDTKPLAEVFPLFAAASDGGEKDSPKPQLAQCGDPLAELPDHLPDPQPALGCAPDRSETTDASPASPAS